MSAFDDLSLDPPTSRPSLARRRGPPDRTNEFLERLLAAQKRISEILNKMDVQQEKHPLAGEKPTAETKETMRSLLKHLMDLQQKIQDLEKTLTTPAPIEAEARPMNSDPFEKDLALDRPFNDEEIVSPFDRPERRPRTADVKTDKPITEETSATPSPFASAPTISPVSSKIDSAPPTTSVVPASLESIVEPVAESVAPAINPEERAQALSELTKYEADYQAYKAQWDTVFADPKAGAAQKELHPEVLKYLADMEAYLAEQKQKWATK